MEYDLGQNNENDESREDWWVLILVLIEDGLGHDEQQSLDVFSYAVLILVLMENELGWSGSK